MKQSSINLLSNKQDYYGLERKFAVVRGVTLAVTVIIFIAGILFSAFYIRQQRTLEGLTSQKEQLLTEIGTYKDDEAKMSLFAKKLHYFDQFSREDARFSPYYNVLVSALTSASSAATLSEFKISKDRMVDFVLTFNTLDEALLVFRDVESEQFTRHFKSLKLNNFTGTTSVNSRYDMEFHGEFKPITTDL